MTKVDFYLLSGSAPALRLDYACRLAHKAWSKGHRIYLHCNDAEQAGSLDSLLWSFRADLFLPHGPGDDEQVTCNWGDDCGSHHDLLINLTDTTPEFFGRFNRLAEIVIEDDAVRVPARERFRFYRERGYPLNSHSIRTAG